MASYPDRLESSVTLLRECHVLHQHGFFLAGGLHFQMKFYSFATLQETGPYSHTVCCECMFDTVCCCIIWPVWNFLSFTQFAIFVLHLNSLLKAQPKPSIYCHIETLFGYLYRYGCLGNNFDVKTWEQLYQCNFGFHECKSAPWNRVRRYHQLNCMFRLVQIYCSMVLFMNPWKPSD